jgi:hypothetical protein
MSTGRSRKKIIHVVMTSKTKRKVIKHSKTIATNWISNTSAVFLCYLKIEE